MSNERMAIIGGGNLGSAIARGLVSAGVREPKATTVTRRSDEPLAPFRSEGFVTTTLRGHLRGQILIHKVSSREQ